MKFLVALTFLAASIAVSSAVLNCYDCNSDSDADCLENPTGKRDCGQFIADLPSTRFRCMTIQAGEGADQFVLRRCTVNNECSFQVQKNAFEWGGKKYTNAQCSECQGDFCNKEKLF